MFRLSKVVTFLERLEEQSKELYQQGGVVFTCSVSNSLGELSVPVKDSISVVNRVEKRLSKAGYSELGAFFELALCNPFPKTTSADSFSQVDLFIALFDDIEHSYQIVDAVEVGDCSSKITFFCLSPDYYIAVNLRWDLG